MHVNILKFWFEEIDKSNWFVQDDETDRLIVSRYSEVHTKANNGELYEWRNTAKGRLAEVIVLDQFSRNMFRGKPLSFAADILALVLAQEAISVGADADLTAAERNFLYMPFMHSESIKIHEVAVGLYEKNGNEQTLKFEIKHKNIIERFGRYPHRNKVLGRPSTAEEIDFLNQPDSAF